MPNIRCPLGSA